MAIETENWCAQPMAICLSGGGYRAAAFHLGTLHYFNRAGLLGNLGALSTISGGSLLGAMYLVSLADGEPFDAFFRTAYSRLLEVDLITDALDFLKTGSPAPSNRHNIITAVAEVYAKSFFPPRNGVARTFGELLAKDHVPEFSINATEFRTGHSFRFRKSARGAIGAMGVTVPREQANTIRVADMVAASACFPGGFEPLEFPNDFVWPGGKVPPEVLAQLGGKSVALMDGGIFDNQGAEILDVNMVADNYARFGLFVICDVDQESAEIFAYPKTLIELGALGRLKVGQVRRGLQIVQYLCLLSFLSLLFQAGAQWLGAGLKFFWDFFLYLVPLVLSGGAFVLLRMLRMAITQNLQKVPKVGADIGRLLKDVPLSQLTEMIAVRVSSLLSLTSAVFMKRIRSLVYKELVSNPERWWTAAEPAASAGEGSPAVGKKRPRWIANLAYELKNAREPGPGLGVPSAGLKQVADKAASLPTSLWFDDESQLRSLVACGQACTCYNLLQHIVRRHGDDPTRHPAPVQALWKVLVADWATLNRDPESLLPEVKPAVSNRQNAVA